MSEINKPSSPVHTIFSRSSWSLRFSFIIACLLIILSIANVFLFSFLGMQINSMVFLVCSLISFVFAFIASLETTSSKATLNWVLFIIVLIAVVAAAATTGFFKAIPQVEMDNISNTLIALCLGSASIFALCNISAYKEEAAEPNDENTEEETCDENSCEAQETIVSEETAEETAVETEEASMDETSEENSSEDNKQEN